MSGRGNCAESRDAARSVAALVPSMHSQVLGFLRACPGVTCAEVEAGLGMKHQTASARLHELVAEGLVDYETRRPLKGRLCRHFHLTGSAA